MDVTFPSKWLNVHVMYNRNYRIYVPKFKTVHFYTNWEYHAPHTAEGWGPNILMWAQ